MRPTGLARRVIGRRLQLLATRLTGLVMARYVLEVKPLASASPDAIVAAVGPNVQRYLTGDIDLPER